MPRKIISCLLHTIDLFNEHSAMIGVFGNSMACRLIFRYDSLYSPQAFPGNYHPTSYSQFTFVQLIIPN